MVSWFLFFTYYWRHRDEFDAEGRVFDEIDRVTHHVQSGFWCLPAAVLLIAAIALHVISNRHHDTPRIDGG